MRFTLTPGRTPGQAKGARRGDTNTGSVAGPQSHVTGSNVAHQVGQAQIERENPRGPQPGVFSFLATQVAKNEGDRLQPVPYYAAHTLGP